MNAKRNSLEQQLYAIQMSEHERNAALRAAQVAERFVGAIEWVCGQAGRFGETGFAKPSPKYQAPSSFPRRRESRASQTALGPRRRGDDVVMNPR